MLVKKYLAGRALQVARQIEFCALIDVRSRPNAHAEITRKFQLGWGMREHPTSPTKMGPRGVQPDRFCRLLYPGIYEKGREQIAATGESNQFSN